MTTASEIALNDLATHGPAYVANHLRREFCDMQWYIEYLTSIGRATGLKFVLRRPLWLFQPNYSQQVYIKAFSQIATQLARLGVDVHQINQNSAIDPLPPPDPLEIVLSFHTYGQGPNRWHIKDSPIDGRFFFNAQGYSGWIALSDAQREFIEEGWLDEAALKDVQAYCRALVRQNASAFPQPARTPLTDIKRAIFYPTQVVDDTVAIHHQLSLIEALEVAVEASAAAKRILIVKRHPLCRSDEMSEALDRFSSLEYVRLFNGSIHDAIHAADIVMTANSAVGLSALLQLKNLVVFGRSEYAIAARKAFSREALFQVLSGPIEPVNKGKVLRYLKTFRDDFTFSIDDGDRIRLLLVEAFCQALERLAISEEKPVKRRNEGIVPTNQRSRPSRRQRREEASQPRQIEAHDTPRAERLTAGDSLHLMGSEGLEFERTLATQRADAILQGLATLSTALQGEREELKAKHAQSEEDLFKLRQELDAERAQGDAVRKERAALSEAAAVQAAEIVRLGIKDERVQNELHNLSVLYEQSRAELSNLLEDLNAARAVAEAIGLQRSKLEADAVEFAAKIVRLEFELRNERIKWQDTAERMAGELESVRQTLADSNKLKEDLATKLYDSDAALRAQNETLSLVRLDLAGLVKTSRSQSIEIVSLTAELQNTIAERDALETRQVQALADMHVMQQDLMMSRAVASAEQKRSEQLIAAAQVRQEVDERLAAELAFLATEVTRLRALVKEQEEWQLLTKQVQNLVREVHDARAEACDLAARNDRIRTEMAESIAVRDAIIIAEREVLEQVRRDLAAAISLTDTQEVNLSRLMSEVRRVRVVRDANLAKTFADLATREAEAKSKVRGLESELAGERRRANEVLKVVEARAHKERFRQSIEDEYARLALHRIAARLPISKGTKATSYDQTPHEEQSPSHLGSYLVEIDNKITCLLSDYELALARITALFQEQAVLRKSYLAATNERMNAQHTLAAMEKEIPWRVVNAYQKVRRWTPKFIWRIAANITPGSRR